MNYDSHFLNGSDQPGKDLTCGTGLVDFPESKLPIGMAWPLLAHNGDCFIHTNTRTHTHTVKIQLPGKLLG